MRKRTVRNGLRLILAALLLIVLASFYHVGIADLFSMSEGAEMRLYRLGIFWAAAFGGYGVVLAAFGLVLPTDSRDAQVRVLPIFFMILATIALFFYLLASSFNEPPRPERLQPGDTITI
jgi:nitrate/nitrite transporter NarK